MRGTSYKRRHAADEGSHVADCWNRKAGDGLPGKIDLLPQGWGGQWGLKRRSLELWGFERKTLIFLRNERGRGKKKSEGEKKKKEKREELFKDYKRGAGRNRSGMIFSHLRILCICLVLFYFQSYLTSSWY